MTSLSRGGCGGVGGCGAGVRAVGGMVGLRRRVIAGREGEGGSASLSEKKRARAMVMARDLHGYVAVVVTSSHDGGDGGRVT